MSDPARKALTLLLGIITVILIGLSIYLAMTMGVTAPDDSVEDFQDCSINDYGANCFQLVGAGCAAFDLKRWTKNCQWDCCPVGGESCTYDCGSLSTGKAYEGIICPTPGHGQCQQVDIITPAGERGKCACDFEPYCGDGTVDSGEECEGSGQAQCASGYTCRNCQCEQIRTTCYKCTDDLMDGDTCESFVVTGTSTCPDGSTKTEGECNLAAGGTCSVHTPACADTCVTDDQCPTDGLHSCVEGSCVLTACVNGANCDPTKCAVIPLPDTAIIDGGWDYFLIGGGLLILGWLFYRLKDMQFSVSFAPRREIRDHKRSKFERKFLEQEEDQ